MKTAITKLLGIEKPIFQGGMAWIADARLAAAVSNAGGLGLISSINAGTEAVRKEIRLARELTDKPFGPKRSKASATPSMMASGA